MTRPGRIAAIAAAVVAIRFDAPAVAAFGLVSALIAPPLVGASPTMVTLLFVAITLVGTTAVSLFRSWRWLPALAFVLAAPHLASWLVGAWAGLVIGLKLIALSVRVTRTPSAVTVSPIEAASVRRRVNSASASRLSPLRIWRW